MKIPLAEQLEELEAEWDRRNREYQVLVARGDLRLSTANMKQDRLEAAINTLAWLDRHRFMFKEYIIYATKMGMTETLPPEPTLIAAE